MPHFSSFYYRYENGFSAEKKSQKYEERLSDQPENFKIVSLPT